MATQETINYKKSWEHEKKRAERCGKDNYKNNCKIEIDRLEASYPELTGVVCTCGACS